MKYAILTGLLLAGCGAVTTQAPQIGGAVTTGPDTCNAAAHQGLIGMDAASSLALPEPKRLVGPNDAVTTDFNASRLNIQLNETDNIIAITCG
ncbi:I78 family peptidase inhibitor [Sulfitobacter sp.]|uniref:I78 family peptidase inhibitor n=1 Tax=Sulfitobacter sp. TaxID=1903071 RepID=UPI003EF6AC3D